MTTPLHCATYGLIGYYLSRYSNKWIKWITIIFFAFIGGLPDYIKFFFGESADSWSGAYHEAHQLHWYYFPYFIHTGLDYLVHDHIKGGWTWYAVPVECVMWIGIFYMIYRIWRGK